MDNTDLHHKEKICNFLGRFFNINAVGEDENFYEKGFVNSLFYMQLVMFIENEFGISIQPKDINPQNFNSINNIVEFVKKKEIRAISP